MIQFKRILYIGIFVSMMFTANLNATSVSDFIDTAKCDKVIDKQLYNICYSYEYKGALGGWTTLQGDKVNIGDIKERPKFYSEKNIPIKYRTKYKDYTGYGKEWNRGHFIVADADLDYNYKVLLKAYTMANIIPQSAKVNQKTWVKVERYGRILAAKFGYINSISIAKYNDPNHKIGNDVVIPSTLYRIYYNDDEKFIRCFEYENSLNIDYQNDKLKNHEIDCSKLRL